MPVYKNGLRLDVNVKGLVSRMDRRKRAYPFEMVGRLKASAHLVRNGAVRLVLKGPATGRIYTRRGITRQASAPGEAPMSDTGTLARSIHIDDSKTNPRNLRVSIVAGVFYAKWLELGTRKMLARPFMVRSFDENLSKIRAILRRPFKS